VIDLDVLLESWNGEELIVQRDQETGAWIFIAIHSTRLGPAAGGTRMKSYPGMTAALQDALRLSEGMTYKFAVPNLPFGGGKAVIAVPSDIDLSDRRGLLLRYGEMVDQLAGRFRTGPDVGTTPADMDIISETAGSNVFSRTAAAGGAGDPGPFTALGVLSGMEAACEHVYGDPMLAGRKILVQGSGDVGSALIDLLAEADARVLFSEIDPDLVALNRDERGLTFVPPEGALDAECDVLAPCALGGVLSAETIPRLRCQIVAGSANNQLAVPSDADRLRTAGVLYAPDYVINVGGAMAIPGIESMGWTVQHARNQVRSYVRTTLLEIFENAERSGSSTAAAASALAERHLAAGERDQGGFG
jgi:leucine dehydrogenase